MFTFSAVSCFSVIFVAFFQLLGIFPTLFWTIFFCCGFLERGRKKLECSNNKLFIATADYNQSSSCSFFFFSRDRSVGDGCNTPCTLMLETSSIFSNHMERTSNPSRYMDVFPGSRPHITISVLRNRIFVGLKQASSFLLYKLQLQHPLSQKEWWCQENSHSWSLGNGEKAGS